MSKCTLEERNQEGAKDPPPVISAPELLTNTELKAFKERMQRQERSVLRISCGEVATVRVPTRPDGQQLCWEFATDSYDIAFGVFFEWTDSPGSEVTVQVSESTDEEDELENGGLEGAGVEEGRGDVERGSRRHPEPPLEEIEPLYRRNCHEVVHSGKHRFPGWGLYHIKFDNSYSLWRAKTLYYHVYYN
uniref:protein TMED8 n=1 Tax=Myxine glutinosa TaxID=7769 RepID=UPI0035901921